jgi:hypothetical protein
MALVKVKVTCSHCKVEHEEYDHEQMNDREKYLAYWNLPFEGPEADAAWSEKENMTFRPAPTVIPDIDGYVSMADGSFVDSRSKHREMLKRNNCVELGNDYSTEQKKHELSRKEKEHLKRTLAEVTYAKLK